MKFLYLSQLTIKVHTIVAVEWDLPMADGCKTTVVHHNISGLPAFQLYSDDSKYEEDKVQLISALNGKATFSDQVPVREKRTELRFLYLSVRAINLCHRAEIDTAENLEIVSDRELLEINGMGMTTVNEIREKLDIWRNANKLADSH